MEKSFRLNDGIRQQTVAAIIKNKYGSDPYEMLYERERELANAVVEASVSKKLLDASKDPVFKGYFYKTDIIGVYKDEEGFSLKLSCTAGKRRDQDYSDPNDWRLHRDEARKLVEKYGFPVKVEGCGVRPVEISTLPKKLAEAVKKFHDDKEKIEQEVTKATNTAMAVLGSCATSKQVAELWPEAYPFLPLPEQPRALSVNMEDVNKLLGL